MTETEFKIYAYPIALTPDEEGRLLVTCRDFPEFGTDGAGREEALANARDAIDLVIRDRLRRGEDVPDPSPRKAGEFVACPEHITAYRIVLARWAQAHGRGAKAELARRLGKGETHVRRLFAPDGGASIGSFVEALSAVGYHAAPSLALTETGRTLGAPGAKRPHDAAAVNSARSA